MDWIRGAAIEITNALIGGDVAKSRPACSDLAERVIRDRFRYSFDEFESWMARSGHVFASESQRSMAKAVLNDASFRELSKPSSGLSWLLNEIQDFVVSSRRYDAAKGEWS
jgi:hypothetical protein